MSTDLKKMVHDWWRTYWTASEGYGKPLHLILKAMAAEIEDNLSRLILMWEEIKRLKKEIEAMQEEIKRLKNGITGNPFLLSKEEIEELRKLKAERSK